MYFHPLCQNVQRERVDVCVCARAREGCGRNNSLQSYHALDYMRCRWKYPCAEKMYTMCTSTRSGHIIGERSARVHQEGSLCEGTAQSAGANKKPICGGGCESFRHFQNRPGALDRPDQCPKSFQILTNYPNGVTPRLSASKLK